MGWQIKEWMCGGFQAVRPDGEKVFIYHRLAWEPARYEESASSYEFRWRGLTAGRLTTERTWRKRLKLFFTLSTEGGPAGLFGGNTEAAINEQDLLEISLQIADKQPGYVL
jgi:hypothetical protein